MMINAAVFYLFALLSVIAAVFTISFASPVKSAISMIFCLFCLAVIYFTLGAHFVGIIQILVYAGAIMVLFLFVIMLLEKRDCESSESGITPAKSIGIVIAVTLFTAMAAAFMASGGHLDFPAAPGSYGSIKVLAESIFHRYIFAFEALSVLVFAAIIGVTLLASKDTAGDKK